ncbi:hypothetical protein TWF694_010730 [Orbilia ellipsospora]
MVKLGNEANPVPVLAQEPNTILPSEGSSLPEYVPVPPLPSDYSNNANFSGYSNLVPSQLAAYNEWIAIQAYHHFIALAHNAGVYIQEERLRSQQRLTNNEEEIIDADNNNFQALGLVDGVANSQATGSVSPTRDSEQMLEEYRRQAGVAQRNAGFHSTRHHALLQEERSRFQDNSPGFHSSSSSSTPSSSSQFSKTPSRRGTPNQPSNNRQQSHFLTISPSQHSFPNFTLTHQGPSSSSMNFSNPHYITQRGLPDPSSQRMPHPYTTISPTFGESISSHRSSNNQDRANMSIRNLNNTPQFSPQSDMQLVPSFYTIQSTGGYTYRNTGLAGGNPMASGSSPAPSPSHYPGSGQQNFQYPNTGHPGGGGYHHQPHQPAAIPPTPVFINNAAGVPVNLSHGAVQTESRGIFIGNLPYNTHWRDLRTFLSPAGNIIRCDVPRKPNNKGRGYATVLYSSAREAEQACDLFNGTMYQGRQIRVRLDTYANTKVADTGGQVTSASTGSVSGGGSGSGGNQSSFFTDGDVEQGGNQGEDQGGRRKSSASV